MATSNADKEDPYLELLDVEANELDDKELEDLMTPEEKIQQKIESEAKRRKQKEAYKPNSSETAKTGVHEPDNLDNEGKAGEEEGQENDDGKYITLFEVRLKNATEWKNRGNDEFKQKNYKNALKNYHGALIFLKGIENNVLAGDAWTSGGSKSPYELKKEMDRGSHPTPDNLKDWKNLKIDCYNNILTCMFKEKELVEIESIEKEMYRYNKMLKYSEEILELDPTNPKCLFKKGKVNFMLEKYDEAYECFRKAQSHVAGKPDKQLSEYLLRCEQLISKHYKEMMGMFKGVFDKMATEEEKEREKLADSEDQAKADEKSGLQSVEFTKFGLTETTPRTRDVPYNIMLPECNQ